MNFYDMRYMLANLDIAREYAGSEFEKLCNENNLVEAMVFQGIRDSIANNIQVLKDYMKVATRSESNTKWTPISEGLPKRSYCRNFLLSVVVDGRKEIITGEFSSISDRDEDGRPLETSHDGFLSFYEPLVGIMHNEPVYNFAQEIPMEYIVAWQPFPEAYDAKETK